MKEIGLYVHIPFCRSKCLYCDFNSYECREGDSEDYVAALLRELDEYQKRYDFIYKTVFIGGGTPTVINCFLIGSILEKLSPFIMSGAEITMESNPGTVTFENLKYYRSLGINRLSIGLQAWQGELLRGLGRIHSPEDFLHVYDCARKSGFDNINTDLMFALPNQTLGMWKETLKKVAGLGMDHISCYSLILEEGTKLYELYREGRVQLPDEEADREMYWTALEVLDSYRYGQYEISNFAKNNKISHHNSSYWDRSIYYGFGPSAHSFDGKQRFYNTTNIQNYIAEGLKNNFSVEYDKLSESDIINEYLMLSLRTSKGLNLEDYQQHFGNSELSRLKAKVSKLNQDWFNYTEKFLSLTKEGMFVSNHILINLFVE